MEIKVKNYKDVEGDRLGEGTSMRWVVSHEDGAENFYMRIIEAQPGSDGPFSTIRITSMKCTFSKARASS